jgi:FixJ family two-component response regulator
MQYPRYSEEVLFDAPELRDPLMVRHRNSDDYEERTEINKAIEKALGTLSPKERGLYDRLLRANPNVRPEQALLRILRSTRGQM